MADETPGDVTQLLLDWSAGDREALNKLMPLVYSTLKRIAYGSLNQLSSNPSGQNLQPTALVHEAYMRLIDQNRVDWQNRNHFFAIAAREIRHLLIDEYRRTQSKKRGGDLTEVSLIDVIATTKEQSIDLLVLNTALEELEKLDPRQARIVELHFFGGHTNKEIAEIEGLGLSTIERELMHAKRWLKIRLS